MGQIEWTKRLSTDGLRLTVGCVNGAEKYFIANVVEVDGSHHTEATAHGGPAARTFVGWDASTKRDSTAVVVAQRVDGRLRVKMRAWKRPVLPGGD